MKRPLVRSAFSGWIAAGLVGCVSSSDGGSASEVPVAVIAEGQYSGVHSQRFEVASDEPGFTGLWLEHASTVSPVPAQPGIDFTRDVVVAAFLGNRGTGGYGIGIIAAEEQVDSIVVSVKATLPGTGCIVTQAES